MKRTVTIPTTLLIQTAQVLEREARQLHGNYTVTGSSPVRWECAAAKADHARYRKLARQLRAAAKGVTR